MEKKWYAIYVKEPRGVKMVQRLFMAHCPGSRFWIPKHEVTKTVRGVQKQLLREFLYNYVFVHFTYTDPTIKAILDESNAGYFLTTSKIDPSMPKGSIEVPAEISEEFIHRIELLEGIHDEPETVPEHFKVGCLVEIINGPFLGSKGLIQAVKSTTVTVELFIFNRSISVDVSPSFLILPEFHGSQN